jgi:hypothetical protein
MCIFTEVLEKQPIAAPTNYFGNNKNNGDLGYYMPRSGNIKKMEVVIHEYLGLIWYKINC